MITILMVDDHALVRVGLRHIFDAHPDLHIVAEAASGEEALKLNRSARPRVVLLDITLPGLSGIEVTARLKRARPGVRVIALVGNAQAPYAGQLLEAGADGCLTKDTPGEELVHAVREVAAGQRYLAGEVAQHLAVSLLPGHSDRPLKDLSAREMEVMMKLAEGHRMRDIAKLLCLSPKTVATYKYRIYDKLGTRSEAGLVRMAMRHGLLPAP